MTPPYAMNQVSFPQMYEQWLVPALFRPWAELLLDRIAARPGERLLDVACGTGVVARLARERIGGGGTVVGVDLSVEMLAIARSADPLVDWREGNAQSLPIGAAERFDVIVCQQGLQFFPDRPAAVREMKRALVPGGRLGVATWFSVAEIPVFREIHVLAERRLGPITDQRHAAGDPSALGALLEDAGFTDVSVDRPSLTIRFADGATFARLNAMALVGMSTAGKTMSNEERLAMAGAIAADSGPVLDRFRDGTGTAFDVGSNVAMARA